MGREKLENNLVKVGVSQTDLEDSISALERLKSELHWLLIKINYEGQGIQDVKDMERKFDTAIDAMTLLLLQFPDYQD